MNDILIDARMLPYTGIGRYTAEICKRLPALDPRRRYRFMIPSHSYKRALRALCDMENVDWTFDPSPRYTLAEHFNVLRNQVEYKPVLFHSMNYIMPPVNLCPSVVTVHDIIRQVIPETFYTNNEFIRRFGFSRFLQLGTLGTAFLAFSPKRFRRFTKYVSSDFRSLVGDRSDVRSYFKMHHLFQTGLMHLVFRNADKIITVSNYSKEDIRRVFAVPESKIEIVYGAASDIFHPTSNVEELTLARSRYGLSERFIMYVGLWRFHKNLHGLIRAFAGLMRSDEFRDVRLAVVGKEDPLEEQIPRLIDQLGLDSHVIFTGYVTDRDLVLLYNLATVVVVPGLHEGFGLPAVEAMACGTPVIASSSTVLPEIVGDAGVLVDPSSEDSMIQSLVSVLSSTDMRVRLRFAGLQRSRAFSWDRAAHQTLEVYEAALSGRQTDP